MTRLVSSFFQALDRNLMQVSSPLAPPPRPSSLPVPSLPPRIMSPILGSSTHLRLPAAPVAGVGRTDPTSFGVTSGASAPLSPVSLLTPPVWDSLKTVSELSGGQSDGVYRLEFVNNPAVVLKSCHTADAQAFALALASTVGISAPLVRWLPNDSIEVEVLQAALQRLACLSPQNVEAKRLSRRIAVGGKSILLMKDLHGLTLGGTGRAHPKKNDATALFGAIGRLAAFDMIMGNQDRFENFDPNDCLGGGELPANFGNVFLPWNGMSAGWVVAIDTCVSDDPRPGVERCVYLKREIGAGRERTTPSAILAAILADPDTLNDYVLSNIVQMLEQVWFLPPDAANIIQRGFIAGLHTVAEEMTPAQLESIRLALGIDEKDLPIATLESRLEALRELLKQ